MSLITFDHLFARYDENILLSVLSLIDILNMRGENPYTEGHIYDVQRYIDVKPKQSRTYDEAVEKMNKFILGFIMTDKTFEKRYRYCILSKFERLCLILRNNIVKYEALDDDRLWWLIQCRSLVMSIIKEVTL